MKVCGKCNRDLSYDSFYSQCNTKDKKSNYCKECKRDYSRERAGRLKRDDPAMYLLNQSCYAAFESKSTYNRDGYENVGCSFDNAKSFIEALWDNEIFRHEWIAQTDVYVANNCIYKYRPTLDRIDPEHGYEMGNIRVLPQYINVSIGYLKRAN